MKLNSKINQSIADAARKVMEAQPAKVEDFKPKQPIADTSMVEKVVAAGMKTRFNRIQESETRAPKEPQGTELPHVDADVKLSGSTTWPKAKKDPKTTTLKSSEVKEDNLAALQSDYAMKMRKPVNTKEEEEPPFEGGRKVTQHKDQYGNPVRNVARHLARKGMAAVIKAAAKKKKGK
jgi:hypothetical protein